VEKRGGNNSAKEKTEQNRNEKKPYQTLLVLELEHEWC
jgi:hypothetical protein